MAVSVSQWVPDGNSADGLIPVHRMATLKQCIIAPPCRQNVPMSDAESIERLRRIGWRDDTLAAEGLRLARVVAQHRAGYELHDGDTLFGAQPDGRFLKRGIDPAERPVVGEVGEEADGTPPHIVAVRPRRTTLSRAAAGERYERQLIATNIDYVLVLTGLDGDFNAARIERYLSLTEGSGAQPVVLLSKVDTRLARTFA
jgi:ribosome biogenesis GTPase